jgi:hypothetical protein
MLSKNIALEATREAILQAPSKNQLSLLSALYDNKLGIHLLLFFISWDQISFFFSTIFHC